MRVAIYTLGCKVNQYETQAMEQELLRRGHTLVPAETEADGYIVNTCSVTAISDKKSRQMIRRCHKLNPNAVVAACGCYVQAAGEKLEEDTAIDLIIGNNKKKDLVDILENFLAEREDGGKPSDAEGRAYPCIYEDPGWMQSVLYLLYYPVRARQSQKPPPE